MFKKLLLFIYRYITDQNFRNLCETSIPADQQVYGAEPRSSQWPKVRDNHLKTDPFCNVCGGKEDLNVHHITPFHIDKSKELDPNNLITLCNARGCHFAFGHLFNWSSYNPDVKTDTKNFKQKVENRA